MVDLISSSYSSTAFITSFKIHLKNALSVYLFIILIYLLTFLRITPRLTCETFDSTVAESQAFEKMSIVPSYVANDLSNT